MTQNPTPYDASPGILDLRPSPCPDAFRWLRHFHRHAQSRSVELVLFYAPASRNDPALPTEREWPFRIWGWDSAPGPYLEIVHPRTDPSPIETLACTLGRLLTLPILPIAPIRPLFLHTVASVAVHARLQLDFQALLNAADALIKDRASPFLQLIDSYCLIINIKTGAHTMTLSPPGFHQTASLHWVLAGAATRLLETITPVQILDLLRDPPCNPPPHQLAANTSKSSPS